MSKRRMFSHNIIESDVFLDMPLSSQMLYIHLGMHADDDGFVNPRRILRMIGASADDLQILIAKRYILAFDSGVVVIKHWQLNNFIRQDRYVKTTYKNELKTLTKNEFGAYTEVVRIASKELAEITTEMNEFTDEVTQTTTNGQPNDIPRVDLGKVRLGKVSNKVTNVTLSNQGSTVGKNTTTMKDLLIKLMEELGHTQSKPLPSRLRKLKVRLNTYSPAEILQAAQNIRADEFMQGDNDRGKRWGNIDYLLRSDEMVDKWLAKDGPIDTKTNHQELLRNAHL